MRPRYFDQATEEPVAAFRVDYHLGLTEVVSCIAADVVEQHGPFRSLDEFAAAAEPVTANRREAGRSVRRTLERLGHQAVREDGLLHTVAAEGSSFDVREAGWWLASRVCQLEPGWRP